MSKRPCKLRLTRDIGTIVASLTIVVSCTLYFARESARTDLLNARMDYLAEQLADVKQTQNQYNEKIDKIYDIVRSK